MSGVLNFLLVGVGGQGTILASDVLANVGLAAGYQVKQAEVHGMSQRGGSVNSHVRWGKVVYSPIVGAGEVDFLLAFEKVEALRYLPQLRPGGIVIVNWQSIEPITVTSGGFNYPNDDLIKQIIGKVTDKPYYIDGSDMANRMGNARITNVILLGTLSVLLEKHQMASPRLNIDVWYKILKERVPAKFIDLNIQGFNKGRDVVIGQYG